MGTWSVDSFGNDVACDWAYSLEDVDDLSLIRQTLETVLNGSDDYLDADVACEGLAACEVIARLKGNWGVRDPYTETIDNWVASHKVKPPENLIQIALTVIERVLAPQSELLELWEEGDASEWHVAVNDLRERVRN
ncbi:DUF4259 domain-containing protein [Schlesneria paludicola]|uniref:DUF4259 domain-containing protein n=1 Tax=Schlesneria paludicola TaxID=360056 RepID=UPI00029AB2DC|nr:DUF4259 domain-containing protein [Schlesneria paludicola]